MCSSDSHQSSVVPPAATIVPLQRLFFNEMNVHFISSSLLYFPINIFFFFLLSTIKTSYSLDDEQLKECSLPYGCGRIQDIGYPFWGDDRPQFCGHPGFELKCVQLDDGTGEDQFMFDYNSQRFRILEINSTQATITMARNDLWETTCIEEFVNTTLDMTLLRFIPEFVRNLNIFYECNTSQISMSIRNNFTCSGNTTAVYADESFAGIGNLNYTETGCRVGIQVPVLRTALDKLVTGENPTLQEIVNQGFTVGYIANCLNCSSGWLCAYNSSQQQFVCLPDQPPGRGPNVRRKLIIGFGAAGISILAMAVIFFIYQRRNKMRYASSFYHSRNMSYHPSSITDLEKLGSKYFGVHIFSYSELEKATNKFDSTRELGDGGFGTVYYGKLQDGRVVAVKRLYENNYKRVEQFMNEVEILTRLRHQYLVSLYGCTSRHSRELLLVYEYVPNGTVADHLHGERAKPGSLPWSTRVSIAIETATALTYLHASDIIHRDVKTNNILLDNNFCVKVADFGLSRLFPTDVTHVSTAPQGTPGYVDPDYHQCYQLTDKSDVFSFGVVLIELISSKPAVDITRHRHEINLSIMAINRIKNHALHELVDPCLGFESDCKVREMIIAVAELAFECLQNEKEMRPSMGQVLERLKDIQIEVYNVGKAEVMDIPAEDIVLLKSCHLLPSQDSGTTSSC